jgi:hypothetical protein
MGEVVSLGKACFAPSNAIAYADAMAGHRFAMLEMAALQEHSPACIASTFAIHGGRRPVSIVSLQNSETKLVYVSS